MPRSGRRIEKSSFAPHYQVFLALLIQERVDRKLSQRQLGKKLGKHSNFVSSVEMADRTLNFVEVRAWCFALDLDWVEFTRKVDEALAAQDAPGAVITSSATNAAADSEDVPND